MTFFFFVIGLEARREFDLGELRERRRFALPLLAGIGGMAVAVAIYLAFNAGPRRRRAGGSRCRPTRPSRSACSRSSAALPRPSPGVHAHGRRRRRHRRARRDRDRLHGDVQLSPLLVALALFGAVLVAQRLGFRRGLVYLRAWRGAWVALLESGVEPVVVGLAMGLLAYAYPAPRSDLERATERFRLFREQPTAELARAAGEGLRSAISPNERLQQLFHPWTSYVIVPLFALANAGIAIDGDFLARGFTSPITLGILFGYVVGKPVGILGASWLVTRLSRGRLRPPVGWAAVAGGGTIAGIGFTVALLVATLAFDGQQLEEAKLGILSAALGAAFVTWLLFRATALLPRRLRIRALLGTAEPLVDLYIDVDPERDHVRGPIDAPVTVVEYGDFECPYCGRAEPVVRELLARLRRRPLRLAAPAAERRPPARPARRRSRRGRGRPGRLLGDARPAAGPTRTRSARTIWSPTPSSWASTSSASPTTCAGTRRRRASPRTSTAPTSAASPARRPSSSTAAATTAPTTSTRCRQPYARPARRRAAPPLSDRASVELAFAPAAAAAVVAGLGLELRLFAPGRTPRRGEAIAWSIGWLLLAVAVAVGIALRAARPASGRPST